MIRWTFVDIARVPGALVALLAWLASGCETTAPCASYGGGPEACTEGGSATVLGIYDQPIGSASALAVAIAADDVFVLDYVGTLRHFSFATGELLHELPAASGMVRDALVVSDTAVFFSEHASATSAATVQRWDWSAGSTTTVLTSTVPFTDLAADATEVFALSCATNRQCWLVGLDGLGAQQSVYLGLARAGLFTTPTELVTIEGARGMLAFVRRSRADITATPTRIPFVDPELDDSVPSSFFPRPLVAAGGVIASSSGADGALHIHRLDLANPVADELVVPSLRLHPYAWAGTDEGIFVDRWDFPLGSAHIGYATPTLGSAMPIATLGDILRVGDVVMAADGPTKLVVAHGEDNFHSAASTDRVHLVRLTLPP